MDNMVFDKGKIINDFHKLYYNSEVWKKTFWLGVPTQKCPLDLWIYQEIIFDLKPDFIIETGTANGGSALYMASIYDLIGKGKIVTVDIEELPSRPKHKRITYVHGSSDSDEVFKKVKSRISKKDKVMVILDSDHSKAHVLKELALYSPLVSQGSYLIVEDTNINGFPVYPDFGEGPMEAVQEFLNDNKYYKMDSEKEKFFMTYNPKGFLKKI